MSLLRLPFKLLSVFCRQGMSSDNSRNGVVTKAEQLCFVEAVLAGKLLPDSTQIEYHFAGWLDKGEN